MKKIITSFLLLIAITSYGQTYTISPSNTVIENVAFNTFTLIPIYQNNIGSNPIVLKWEYISDNMVPGWDLSICDFAHCYPGLPLSGTMDTVPVGGKGYIDLNIDPFNFPGSGYLKYYVYQDGFYANGDTLTYIVTVGPNSITESNMVYNIDFYPNPATDKVIFRKGNIANAPINISIFNAIGQLVYSDKLIELENKIDVSALSNGVYFIQFSDETKQYFHTKKLVKTN